MKNFVLIGVAGYIAPKHLAAIKETGNNLLAALDKHDAVGVLDSYFPDCDFFTEFERFDRHCEKLKRNGTKIDYVVVCSPNYLHDAHIRFGLRIGANVICEKPIVLNPWNIEALMEIEKETGKKVYCILQLRLHQAIIDLKQKIDNSDSPKKYEVDLKYITSRGNWYHNSWKGDIQKSGGITTNIGIHFFDILLWIFGTVIENKVTQHNNITATGTLVLKKAVINWMLSIDSNKLPISNNTTYRSLSINNEVVEFSNGFTNLHTDSYAHILQGNGFTLNDTLQAIQLVYQIRKHNLQ